MFTATRPDRTSDVERHSASVIYIDPSMAKRVLEKNTRNRPIRETHVRWLMDEMLSGRWQYNGEAIKWSVADELLDGQHRLTALSRLDDSHSYPFLVVRGLPSESQNTMDQGRTRTAGDQLAINDILRPDVDAKVIASAIRVYIQWSEGKLFGDQVRLGKVRNPEVVEWARNHAPYIEVMDDLLCSDLRRVKMRPSLTLAIIFGLYLVDPDATYEFAHHLYTGEGLAAGHPVLTLRDRLDRIQTQQIKTSDRDYIAFVVIAWNAWRQGRTMTKFQRPHGGTWASNNFPKPV